MNKKRISIIFPVLLLSTPLYAAEGIPGIFFILPLSVISLFVIVPVEWVLLKYVLFPKKEYRYFEGTLAANIFSALIGNTFTWFILVIFQLFFESKGLFKNMNQYLWITEDISVRTPAVFILAVSMAAAFFLERLVYRKYIWNEKKIKLIISILGINTVSFLVMILLIPFVSAFL